MNLVDFKTAVSVITGNPVTNIKQVFFDYSHIANVERDKLYPYVLFDLNSLSSKISWLNGSNVKEFIKIKAYAVNLFDRGAVTQTDSREKVWDGIRSDFRGYLVKLNTQGKVQVTNMDNMGNELFSIGINADSEIAVCFELEMTLFC